MKKYFMLLLVIAVFGFVNAYATGSAEMTTTAADDTNFFSIQHKDGSIDIHVTQPAH